MKALEVSGILGRAFLAGTLACSVFTTVSGALVLHEHGGRAHLHVLVDSSLPSNTPWSWQYGHTPIGALDSGIHGVRVLVVVAAGSVFLPMLVDADLGVIKHVRSSPCTLSSSIDPQAALIPPFATDLPIRVLRRSTATVLVRNHTLLI